MGPDLVRTSDYHPGPWFQSLAVLAARRRDLWGKLRTVFVGDIPAGARGFEHVGEAFPVVTHGYQSFPVAAEAMRAADGLLLLNLSTSDDSPSFTIHGKLFEYLAAGPPIFAVCGPGDCPNIIQRTGTGVWTHDRRPADMADQLESWLDGRLRSRQPGAKVCL